MNGLYTIEDQKKYILSRASMLREAADSMNRVKEVVRKFDGKIYNCKFDEAIQDLTEDTNRFYVSNQYGWFYIQFCPRNGSYNNTVSLLTGYSCKASDSIKEQTNTDYILFDGKRVNAEKMIEGLNRKRAALLKEAYELETVAADLEKTVKQINDTKSLLNTLVQSLPSIVRDACNLKYCY